jgi:chloramphenicol-sensitive protein RarD
VAAYWAFAHGDAFQTFAQEPGLYVLLPLLAVISAAGFISYTVASRHLPFSLFGLLGYVEPVLMVAVALVLGESIQTEEWLTYSPIWVAVLILVLDGGRHLWRVNRSREVYISGHSLSAKPPVS